MVILSFWPSRTIQDNAFTSQKRSTHFYLFTTRKVWQCSTFKCTRYTLASISTFWLILTLVVIEGLNLQSNIVHHSSSTVITIITYVYQIHLANFFQVCEFAIKEGELVELPQERNPTPPRKKKRKQRLGILEFLLNYFKISSFFHHVQKVKMGAFERHGIPLCDLIQCFVFTLQNVVHAL